MHAWRFVHTICVSLILACILAMCSSSNGAPGQSECEISDRKKEAVVTYRP